jgi:SAM-dependent methyltransferase
MMKVALRPQAGRAVGLREGPEGFPPRARWRIVDAREALHVWERIAPSYAAARTKPWPLVEEFLDRLPAGARVLDVGAGPGRHARAARARGLDAVALDAVAAFLRPLARELPAIHADAAALPVRDASVDAVLFVAVWGTMPMQRDRVAALREARRVLRPGGRLLATAWAKWQRPYLQALVGHGSWVRVAPGEVRAPWVQDGERVGRPYVLATRRAFAAELRAAGWEGARPMPAWLAAERGLPDNWVADLRR